MEPIELIKKIKKIHIKSGRMVDTMMAGSYRSVFRGTGIEFEEVREYTIGDDVKSIDWNVSARMGRPYIKLYREERELVLMLLVDLSASMGFGTAGFRKKDAAVEAAAILAFNAIKNNDRVGAILFTDRVEKYIPPKKGSAHIWRVIKELFSYTPEHTGTDIQSALTYLGNVWSRRAIVFLISDFFAHDSARAIKTASRKHEMISVFVSDSGDFTLPPAGLLRITDMETGAGVWLDAFDRNSRKAYEREKQIQKDGILAMLRRCDVDCIQLSANEVSAKETHVADRLLSYFRLREKRLR
ncbi:MAG: DUF58 domain-containing protein [Thermodesulfobacteriota bacterium]|nr:DUF58 domain-containing protein [Thermodesulfobacteriota bacterium]